MGLIHARVLLVWLRWLLYILILVRTRNGRQDDHTYLGIVTTQDYSIITIICSPATVRALTDR